MKCLFLTAWFPDESIQYAGSFVKDHAEAVSLLADVTVLHLPREPSVRKENQGLARNPTPSPLFGTVASWRFEPRRQLGTAIWVVQAIFASLRVVRQTGRPDLIHAHVLQTVPVAWALGKLLRCPVVLTEHWSGYALNKLRPWSRVVARYLLPRLQVVMPVAEQLAEQMEKYAKLPRVEVVPNAIDTQHFQPSTGGASADRPRRILFVGGITKQKGWDVLLRALPRLPEAAEWTLDVIGTGDMREVAEASLGDRAIFHGVLPRPSVAQAMRQGQVLVLPSHHESLPCVVLEALCSGLPVVATDVGDVSRVIRPGDGVVVPRGDDECMAAVLTEILNGELTFDAPDVIANRAALRFSYEAVAQRLISIYESLPTQGST